jgi:tetratricopeptide (TPR) repeat protein
MKKFFLSILIFMFSAGILYCTQRGGDENIYNSANQYYASKEYQNALRLYSELIERGIKNPHLFFNLGNTYFKLGQLGYAILYYEKALSLRPFDRDTRENLDYARRSLKERVFPLYSESFFKFLRVVSSYIKPSFFAILELLFFTGFILFMQLFLFIPLSRNKLKKYILLFSILFFVFGISTFSYQSYEKKHPKGIVVEGETYVLSAPITESEVLFSLYEGTRLKLLEARGEWLRIILEDGREGWILAQSTVFI